MKSIRSKTEIIILIAYVALALLCLTILLNNAFINLTGNRSIGALFGFVYVVFILIGIYYQKKIFYLISIFNFLLGTCLIAFLGGMALIDPYKLYVWLLLFGVVGFSLSTAVYIRMQNKYML